MRHVSCERTIMDSRIQIKFVDSKNQLTDINHMKFHTR